MAQKSKNVERKKGEMSRKMVHIKNQEDMRRVGKKSHDIIRRINERE